MQPFNSSTQSDMARLRAYETVLGTGAIVARELAPGGLLSEAVVATRDTLWPDLPYDMVEVLVDGVAVPAEILPRARAKAGTVVALRPRVMGKGLKLVGTALVALLAIGATLASGGAFAPLATALGYGGLFAAGSTSAFLLGAGLSLSAMLLNYALAGQPVKALKTENKDIVSASITGNVLAAGASIQRAYGEVKLYPQLGCEPLNWLDGRIEMTEAIFVLAGEHEIDDIRSDGTPLGQIPGVSWEIRQGLETDAPLNLVTRWGHTEPSNLELRWYRLKTDDKAAINIITTLEDSLPQWTRIQTTPDANQIWLAPQWVEGLIAGDTPTKLEAQPLRIRMRPAGTTTWRNLPELHFAGREQRPIPKMIYLTWDAPGPLPTPPTTDGVIRAFHRVPVQSVSPAGIGGWQAESIFAASTAINDVARVAMLEEGATIYLAGSSFPPGVAYEIEMMSGQVYDAIDMTVSTYAFSGGVYDLFGYVGAGTMARDQTNRSSRIVLARHSTVYHESPVKPGKLAVIAVRGAGVNLGKLSCIARGLVRDWNDDLGEWSNLIATSNPAPHLRSIYASRLTTREARLGDHEIDNVSFLDFRDRCIAQGFAVNMVAGQGSMDDVAGRIAGCGYAALSRMEQLAVVMDRDRSAEAPQMILTPRDARGFTISGGFVTLPDGLRCTYLDRDQDYRQQSLVVLRPGVTSDDMLEARAYDGLTSIGEVRRRALHDLAEVEGRKRSYTFEAPQRALDLRRGALIGVGTDTWDQLIGYGRVRSTVESAGNLVSLVLDFSVDLPASTDVDAPSDIDAVVDIDGQGTAARLRIHGLDGTVRTYDIAGHAAGTTTTITLPMPVATPAGVTAGAIIWVGSTVREMRRLLVESVSLTEDLAVRLTARDEAPQLHAVEAAGERLWGSGRPWGSGRGWGT